MKYWNYIVENLPNYSTNKDVYKVDILTRYLEGQEVHTSEIEYVFGKKEPTYESALTKMFLLEQKLMAKAMVVEQSEFAKSLKKKRGEL